MPTIVQTQHGKVSALWGAALIRTPDGHVRALQVGDVVNKGGVVKAIVRDDATGDVESDSAAGIFSIEGITERGGKEGYTTTLVTKQVG